MQTFIKMKNKLHYTLLICFLLISNLVFSQQRKDTVLNSTRFLFPEFTDGVVSMKDGQQLGAKLNYDTSLDQMQFLGANNEILYLGEPDKLFKVVIANRTFITIKNYFVESIAIGPVSLYLRVHQKRNTVKIGAYGGESQLSSIGNLTSVKLNEGTTTKLAANEKVSYKSDLFFYVMINGKTKIVLNQKELLKCFPSNKELLKKEMETQNTNFNSVDSIKKIIDWINEKGIKS